MRKYILITILMLPLLMYSQGGLSRVDEVLATLEQKSAETLADGEYIMELDSLETSVLGFLQGVGYLSVLQKRYWTAHATTVLNITVDEIGNVILWYKNNRKYFTDEMYNEYHNVISEYSMVNGSMYSYYKITDENVQKQSI